MNCLGKLRGQIAFALNAEAGAAVELVFFGPFLSESRRRVRPSDRPAASGLSVGL